MIPYIIAGAIGFVVAKLFEEDEAPKYADGGSVLLAPNGKPSNLNAEQYKLVRSEDFKKWFGDWQNDPETASKIVDENGEPLVVYHGTTQKFNVFKKVDKLREDWGVRDYGMYFTNSEKTAQIYSLDFQKKTGQSEIIENKYQTALNKWMISKSLEDLEKVRQLSSERIELSSDLLNSFEKVRVIECFLNIRNPFLIDGKGKLWHQVLKGAIDIALTNQKDGMIVSNIIEVNHIIQTTYVAFNPEQIKLADGTNTTFDSNNPDIRFDDGGNVNELYQDVINGYELLLEIEIDKKKIKLYEEIIEGYNIISEVQEVQEEVIQEEMNEEVVQDDFTPSYLMTLDEYKAEVTPLIQAYKKFLKKNSNYFVSPNIGSGIAEYSLEEALEQINDEYSAFLSRGIDYENDNDKEKSIRSDYSYQKTRKFDDNYTQPPTPPNLITENKDFIQKLKKYFTIEDLNERVDKDEVKSNKRAIRRAIDNGLYKKLLTNKEIELSTLQEVSNSVGIRLPKSVFDISTQNQMKYESELGKLLNDIPRLSREKLKELIEQIKVDLIPLEEEVYEKEYARYSQIMQDFIGQTNKEDNFSISLPIWQDLLVSESEYKEEPSSKFRDFRGNPYMESVKYATINGLKNNWENKLSQFVKEKVDELKNSIIIAIVKNFISISMPITSIERLKIKTGYLGFDGSYKFNFENGSSFIMNFQGISAGGYNIQKYHFRFLTNFSDVKLANGSKSGTNYYDIVKNFSIK